jgi:hypothetical protein
LALDEESAGLEDLVAEDFGVQSEPWSPANQTVFGILLKLFWADLRGLAE